MGGRGREGGREREGERKGGRERGTEEGRERGREEGRRGRLVVDWGRGLGARKQGRVGASEAESTTAEAGPQAHGCGPGRLTTTWAALLGDWTQHGSGQLLCVMAACANRWIR